jgi:hypothetical protein
MLQKEMGCDQTISGLNYLFKFIKVRNYSMLYPQRADKDFRRRYKWAILAFPYRNQGGKKKYMRIVCKEAKILTRDLSIPAPINVILDHLLDTLLAH